MAAANVMYVSVMTMPVVAAALGVYLLHKTSAPGFNLESSPRGFADGRSGSGSRGSERRNVVATGDGSQEEQPKLAPQFDGIFCFETLVPAFR
ncbi:unnamed protein product [Linum trigynum]|uniref:Uncharacterized protein n=1 Tax=Linum trigynum TaxID=586398 RepID=A0AAV2G182_9ROSI